MKNKVWFLIYSIDNDILLMYNNIIVIKNK